MLRLQTVIITAIVAAFLISGSTGRKHGHHEHDSEDDSTELCSDDPFRNLPSCNKRSSSSPSTSTDNDQGRDSSTTSQTPLETAHWCRSTDNIYVPLGHRFLKGNCTVCECTKTHQLRCSSIICLPNYCVDDSYPARREGQCCAQCKYERAPSPCPYNGINYPHGAVLKSVSGKMQCWCQFGNIECRNYVGTAFEGLDIMSDSSTILIIAVILIAVFLISILLCCCCTFFIYFHIQRNQGSFEQAYDYYVNGVGWQPMEDEEQYPSEEKQIEAEKGQTDEGIIETVPPPYDDQEKK